VQRLGAAIVGVVVDVAGVEQLRQHDDARAFIRRLRD
jgi:hypothetical protein